MKFHLSTNTPHQPYHSNPILESQPNLQSQVAAARDSNEIAVILQRWVKANFACRSCFVFVHDPNTDQYLAAPGLTGDAVSDLCFRNDSPLLKLLVGRKVWYYQPDDGNIPDGLAPEHARLDHLAARVLMPLNGKEILLGWIALGEKVDQSRYSSEEIDQLAAAAELASDAFERVQMIAAMENRIREMDVLSRVAQGINVTLELDDIYELIYAQSSQIIPIEEFHVLLFEPPRREPVRVFCISAEERLCACENQAVDPDSLPEYELIRQGRIYASENYTGERRKRGYLGNTGLDCEVWVAFPLRTGAESIGMVCAGRKGMAERFTADQQQLLQAIADQAAGAIFKARLLSESEKRAHQLRTLYDMTRQLTSTLDQELLLKNILRSAVEILNCEAGSLLMADQQTKELVFKTALGPVADNLIHQRMPWNAGVVGKTFSEAAPVIVNEIHNSPLWFDRYDQQTGFTTKSLLAVPMQVKDRTIGVIEVVNHKGGVGFSPDDQELLSAFASQAGVAIENARLYTLTDQALAARVEELSVMQRIDRELNTSLDIRRAMQITLDWAMRQSGATAGLVGMVELKGIRVMASSGYSHELDGYVSELLPIDKIHANLLTEDGKPILNYPDGEHLPVLSGAQSQVAIPIQRKKQVGGLILLESRQAEVCSQEALAFLMRLGDHASIAIANAQLYDAVQSANDAKSEFVSFVAHELKNPMTSIKGYTELLAARAVGPINENQESFLHVIRSNIDRMNTLVSDLNDLSKIEAARLRLDYSSMVLDEVVSEVVRSTRRQIEGKRQIFEVHIPEDVPPVWADRNRLIQILVNLISNAHKYTGEGGIITLGAEVVNRSAQSGEDHHVHVWVQDTGIGINAEDRGRIFQKFFRSDDLKTREAPGAGLGLNITRSLVEMQGGKIWFESEFRQGTTFHFTIPLAG